jgi:hypothetical protein
MVSQTRQLGRDKVQEGQMKVDWDDLRVARVVLLKQMMVLSRLAV